MAIANFKEVPDHPEIAHIVLMGSIDESNLEELKTVIRPYMDNGDYSIIALDVNELEYINSKVVGYIASLYTLGQVNSTKIVIVGENHNIIDILSLVGLTTLLEQKKTLDELY